MKALCYRGPRKIVCETMPAPKLEADTDIVVKMTSCGICGSDLHIYHGEGFSPDTGYAVGHEAIGEVVETGRNVRRVKSGDKVMISAAVGCGNCSECLAGRITTCLNGAMGCYGLGPNLQGCQAEAIRVPYGDLNVAPIPDGLSDDQALLLTDNLPTAWFACKQAGIAPGKVVVVVGLGPIGLMAVESAFVMGASRVFAVDLVPQRRAIAEKMGATVLDPSVAQQTIEAETKGLMADCAVECVGADATIRQSIDYVGRFGTVSVIGVNQNQQFNFPMGLAFFRGLNFKIGCCSVPEHWPALVPLIQAGRLHPERTITHRLTLDRGEEAYAIFDGRKDGALKVVMTP